MINSKINVISIKDKNACVLLYVVLIVFCVFSLIFNHASLYSWTQTILFILIMTVMFLYIMFSKNITYIDSVLLFFVAIYTIYRYTKNAPNVVLEKKNIFVNDQKIDFEDIQNISLTGKKHFPYLY